MKQLLPFVILFCVYNAKAQTPNLVPNHSFELYNSCPGNLGQAIRCTSWRPYTGGSSDYFNACASGIAGVPSNTIGSQSGLGNAYMAVVTCLYSSGPTNYKEYIAAPIATMQAGGHYEVSMSVSLADYSGWAANDLGVYFYDSGPNTVSGSGLLNVTPQVSYSSYGNITDKINWTRLTALYTADSAYDNIVIGGFTNATNLSVTQVTGSGNGVSYSHYYVDSVVVRRLDTLFIDFNSKLLCGTDSFVVNYFAKTGLFTSSNIFTVQLSDANGSFLSPINIGSKASTTSGAVTVGLPANLTPGAGYRMRIISSSFADTSLDNNNDIAIAMSAPGKPVITSNGPLCAGYDLNLSATAVGTVTNWSWTGPNNFISSLYNPVIYNSTTAASGNYIVTAYYYGCSSSDTAAAVVKAIPAKPMAVNSGPVCEGTTLNLSAANAITGATYLWTGPLSYSANTANTSRSNTTLAHSGDYIVTVLVNGCEAKDTTTATIKPFPAAPVITNNGPLCPGSILAMTATSTAGSFYQWTGPNNYLSTQQNPFIANVNTSHSGLYELVVSLNGCTRSGSTTVLVNPTPATPVATSNTPVCPNTPINLFANTLAGATYNWSGPASFSSTQQNPVINNTTFSQAGIYSVTATVNNCVSLPGTTNVVVAIPPVNYTVGSNSPVCAGGTLNLNVSNMNGATWTWNGPNGFTSGQQNPVLTVVPVNSAGTYSVYATINGCQYPPVSTNVIVTSVSSLGIYPSPNDTLCANNANASFVAVPFNAGTAPQYQWYKNNNIISGATNISYPATGINDGDSFYCRMIVTGLCADPLELYSNKLGMTVLPVAAGPSVTVTADPGTLLSPWQLVKFTAVATGAGAMPKYQWRRNGQDVIGATSDVWSANNLSNGDTISCVVTSDVWCATPASAASNRMVVHIKTGIEDIDGDSRLTLYPNPNNGSFSLNIPPAFILRSSQASLTPFKGGMVGVDVVSMVGQTVYQSTIQPVNRSTIEIALPESVSNGVYLLKLHAGDRVYHVRFTVSR